MAWTIIQGCFFIAVCALCHACPSGWEKFQNHCYLFQTDIENWVNARKMCKWHGSDLIAIETKQEQDWFVSQALTFNHTDVDDGFWLSATDWSEEGTWVWESVDTPLSYVIWGDFQPNNRNNSEHCMAALKYFNYAWSDEFCDWDHLQYVCEKE